MRIAERDRTVIGDGEPDVDEVDGCGERTRQDLVLGPLREAGQRAAGIFIRQFDTPKKKENFCFVFALNQFISL